MQSKSRQRPDHGFSKETLDVLTKAEGGKCVQGLNLSEVLGRAWKRRHKTLHTGKLLKYGPFEEDEHVYGHKRIKETSERQEEIRI